MWHLVIRLVSPSLLSAKKILTHVILFKTEECLMKITGMIVAVLLLVLGFTQTARSASSFCGQSEKRGKQRR